MCVEVREARLSQDVTRVCVCVWVLDPTRKIEVTPT